MHLGRLGHFPFGVDTSDCAQAARGQDDRPEVSASLSAKRKGKTMRISDFCFVAAAIAALVGMTLGMTMGIAQDFTLAPAHAHLNLLGWVTMAIYGLYHRGVGRLGGFVGWLQVGSAALGAGLMALGLGMYLAGGDERFFPLVIAGSLLAVLGMVLFAGLVLADIRRQSSAAFEAGPMSG